MNPLRISKLEAAQRQLNRAIRMLFEDDDPICTHTLAGAASTLLADLVEHYMPGATWEQKVQEDSRLSQTQFFSIARKAQNFLKHADQDPDGALRFDPHDTDATLTLAVFNAMELGPLSPEADVFQLWALALLCPIELKSEVPFCDAIAYFGDLWNMSRAEQLAAGRKGLREYAGK